MLHAPAVRIDITINKRHRSPDTRESVWPLGLLRDALECVALVWALGCGVARVALARTRTLEEGKTQQSALRFRGDINLVATAPLSTRF